MTEIHQYYAMIAVNLLVYIFLYLAIALFCSPKNQKVPIQQRKWAAIVAILAFIVYLDTYPDLKSGVHGAIRIFWATQCRWIGSLTVIMLIGTMLLRHRYFNQWICWSISIAAAGGILYRLMYLGDIVR
ncbi:hypothetical protein [Rubritalea squalenifaciens]|nr:hypothetical protein [Rubritalea squalenifaciens]